MRTTTLRTLAPFALLTATLAMASLLALGAVAAPRVDDPVAELGAAHERAFEAWTEDRLATAGEELCAGVRHAAATLAELEDEAAASALADEIEYALVRLWSMLSVTQNRAWIAEHLAGVEIDPRHGAAHAVLVRLQDADSLRVHPLFRFGFVGPFDNERGAGLDRLPAAATDPRQDAFEGKVRTVVPRTTPDAAPPSGAVELAELIDPWDQACVVARTFVRAPRAGDALLYFAASSEARVWVNGEGVLTLLGRRLLVPDAHAAPIRLEAGWNEIAVLVGGEDEPPVFTARLAEAGTARPLDLEHRATPPDAAFPLALTKARVDAPAPPPGIRRRVAAADDARSVLRRSILASFYQPVPLSDRPGRADATRALELAPDSLDARIQFAQSVRDAGSSVEIDVNPWLDALDQVLELAPDSAWAWRQRALHSGWAQPFAERALDEIDRALDGNPDSALARVMRGALLDSIGRGSLGDLERRRLLDHPHADLWVALVAGAAEVLEPNDPRREALARAAFEATSDPSYLSELAWYESQSGPVDAVRSVESRTRTALQQAPWNVGLRVGAAAQLVGIGETDRALAWIDEALALAPERASTHRWLSRALLAAGDEEAAVAALERLLELDFSAEDDRRLLEQLRSEGVEPFHEPYREPLAEVIARTASPEVDTGDAGPGGPEETSREVLLSRLVVDVQPDGTAKRYYRLVTRVLNDRGARDMDRIPFRAFGNQEVRVLTADVQRADGTVERARTGRSSFGMVVDLPPLERGDVVDVEWRVDDLFPTFFGQYFGLRTGFAPDPSVPTFESHVVLRNSPELPLVTHARRGAPAPVERTLEDGTVELSWRMDDLAPLDPEPFMPPSDELLPTVEASSYPSWDAFGTWWWDLIEEEIRVSDEMRAKVRELTADATTPLEKLRAIYDFVVTDIRYNAWEFGVHGYQPYSAPVIFSRGFGDCKDKAILLRALLGEVGIEAWPVLIDAQDRRDAEDLTLALVEHFNHCIAYVPEQGGLDAMFLDGTARFHPLGVLPAMDDGAEVLVVKDGVVERRSVPMPPADEHRVEQDATLTLAADGSAEVRLVRRAFGRNGPGDRAAFTGSAEDRRAAAERMLSGLFGPLSGEASVTTSDLEDLDTPVRVEVSARAERVADPVDGGLEVPVVPRAFGLLQGLASESVADRDSDLLLGSPRADLRTTTVVLPSGLGATDLPEPVALRCEDAEYELRVERTEDGWRVHERLAFTTNRIPVERYGAFRTFAMGVDEAQSADLRAEPVR